MPDITLTPILETDEELQLFTPSDPYRYDVDNRPLRRLLINDQRLRDALVQVIDWLNSARDGFDTLPERLDNIQAQIDAAAGPAYLIGDNSEPFTFDTSNNVLRLKVDDSPDWQVVTFPTGTLTAAEVADQINSQTTGITASVASANRVKIASQTVGTSSRIFVDSIDNGSTANAVLGFEAAGESTDFSTLEARVSAIEEEIIAARFSKPTLADFLAVSFNPDGTLRDDAIAFTATSLRNLTLSGIRRQENYGDGVRAVGYNLYWDADGALWASSADSMATSWYNEAPGPDRGTRREFPPFSYVIARQNRIEIVDVTDTITPELWLGFSITSLWQSGASYTSGSIVAHLDATFGVRFYKALTDHTATSDNEPGVGGDWTTYWQDVTGSEGTALFGTVTRVGISNGILGIGTREAGLFLVDFKNDKIHWLSTSGRRVFVGAIADRNSYGLYDVLIPEMELPSNSVRDFSMSIVDGEAYGAVATANGLAILTPDHRSHVITHSTGSSSTACSMLGRYLAFSMGPAGSESRVYVIRDVTNVTGDGEADTIADTYFDAHTIPAFDSYATTALDITATEEGTAIVRGSSHGVKVIYDRGNRNASWAQFYQATRDASLMMKGDVRGCWLMDLAAAPDEPVDDVSHNQNHLVAKGSTGFTPVALGGAHVYSFDGVDQYLINQTDADRFSFVAGTPFSLSFYLRLAEARDCTLVAKWNENTNQREWMVFIEGGVLKMRIYDEDNDGYIERASAFAEVEVGKDYVVQISYDGSNSPGGIHFYVNGSPADGSTSVSGAFLTMRATTAALTVGAHTQSDGSMGNFFKGELGLLMICAEEGDEIWFARVRRQIDRWRYVATTRLGGDVNRVVDVSCSPTSPIVYAALSNSVDTGRVTRFSLVSASPLQSWSAAEGTEDDFSNVWGSDNILSVSSSGSLRVFLHANGLWFELDPIDLRRACTFLGDFSIDGVNVAYRRADVYYVGSGRALRTYVRTLTADDVSDGYVELPLAPSSPQSLVALVVGDGVLINAFSPGSSTEAPDYAVVGDKFIFRNGVSIGDYTSSGLSELLGAGDTVVFIIG